MTLCSCVLGWAESILWLMCGSTPGYLTIILLWFLSIFHVIMERSDNGNYLGHFPLLNVISLRQDNISSFCSTDGDEITLENWSAHIEEAWAWTQILRPTKLRLRANQRGRGQTLTTKSVPPVRSPRNPHDWGLSKLKCWGKRMHSLTFIRYKIKLRQNRRLQHLKCLYTCVHRRHSKQYDEEIDR